MRKLTLISFVVVATVMTIGLSTPRAHASRGEIRRLDSISVPVAGPDARAAIEKVLTDVPALLKKYQPAGVTVQEKSVQEKGPRGLPRVSVKASKMMITTRIRGDVSTRGHACGAPANPSGYEFEMSLADSDENIVQNIDRFSIQICITEKPDGSVTLAGVSFAREGERFGVFGPTVQDIFRQQTKPLVTAFTQRINEVRSEARDR